MSLNKKPPRGMRDFFPSAARERESLFENMRSSAESFGYEPYDGPIIEEIELYLAKSGEELITEQIYSFEDRGKRTVALRPEMTPTVARMVSQIHREAPKPLRWYSIPNLLRYEKPQRGRLREHWQFNCDIFGASGRKGEIEILHVAIHLLESFGANEEQFEILVNDRQIVDGIFKEVIKAENKQVYRLYKIVDRAKKDPREKIEKLVSDAGLNNVQAGLLFEYLDLKTFSDLGSFLEKNGQADPWNSFQDFLKPLSETTAANYVKFDPCIVRGLDYYTGIVFEIFDKHPDNRRAICGGGAYANLLQIFNEPAVPGVGFGLGDVTLRDFLDTHGLLQDKSTPTNDIILCHQNETGFEYCFSIANKLRKRGLKVVQQLEKVKFKKAFSLAEKQGASFIGLVGDQEVEASEIQIKNLKTKEQNTFSINALDEIEGHLKNE